MRSRTPSRRNSGTFRLGAGLTAWAQATLDAESKRVANAARGTRNATLNRAAFNLGRLAAAGLLDQSTIRHELEASAHTVGLGQRETQRTLDSGLAVGAGCAPTAPRHGRGVEAF